MTFRGQDLLAMEPEERSHAGLFLSFQAPIEIPGVSNTDFMRMSYNAKRKVPWPNPIPRVLRSAVLKSLPTHALEGGLPPHRPAGEGKHRAVVQCAPVK